MAFRLTFLAAMCWLTFAVGCDETYTPPAGSTPANGATTTATSTNAATGAAEDGARERIALGAIPFTIEVPRGWLVQPGVTNKIVLHGRTPSGEIDVLLGNGPIVKAAALPLLVRESAKSTNDKHVKSEVVQREKITIIKTIAPQLAPGAVPSPDPELVPMGWTVQVIVSDDKADLHSYELTFVGLSQGMFDKDELFLQRIMDSLRYEPAGLLPVAP
jgi:hypothetical protein